MDPSQKVLSKLHEVYKAGNLRILAGAGVSTQSELPNWEKLNHSLLRSYLSETLRAIAPHHIDPGDSLADAITADVYEGLGRDAVAELILKSSKTDEKFHESLAGAIYQDRQIKNLYVSDLQRQIASLSINPRAFSGGRRPSLGRSGPYIASIYTTNFDPLLEMAIAHACFDGNLADIDPDPAVAFRNFRLPVGASDDPASHEFPQVRHLHGWIDPDGQAGGQIVYAESHYVRLQNSKHADANVQTEDIFRKAGATVIIGMSLTDPNLRRLLYSRSSDPLTDSAASIYAFMRQGVGLDSVYAAKFWELLNVKLISFFEYEELPCLIRQIQWGVSTGPDAPKWFHASAAFSAINLDGTGSESWYEIFSPLLRTLHKQIDCMYLTQAREKIRVSFFAPAILAGSLEPCIYELGSVDNAGEFGAGSADQLIKGAKERKLDIGCDTVQGLGGLAFIKGAIHESTADKPGDLDLRFTSEMRESFDRGPYRDWRSMLAVPILGGPFWLPLGVFCIHSNFDRPFWKRLQKKAAADFKAALLKAGRLLLDRRKTL